MNATVRKMMSYIPFFDAKVSKSDGVRAAVAVKKAVPAKKYSYASDEQARMAADIIQRRRHLLSTLAK
jgi:hypothetical protein